MMVNDENRHQTWKQNTWGPPTSRVTYNKIKPLWQDPQCPALAVCCLSVQFLTCMVPLCLGTHWLLLNHVTRSHTCHSSNLTHILNQVPILFQSALYFTFETFRHYLLEFSQTHVYWAGGDAIQPSHPVAPFSPCPQSFPASGSFPMSHLFASGGQIFGASASASVLSMNIQGWFPLGLTSLISLHPRNSQ